MLGPDPATMGAVKNLFWGNFREDLLFPYPVSAREETVRCDALLAKLDQYLLAEHPTHEIDQDQHIPHWVITSLFDIGVLGMTISVQHGGGGFGATNSRRNDLGWSVHRTAELSDHDGDLLCSARGEIHATLIRESTPSARVSLASILDTPHRRRARPLPSYFGY